MTPLHPRQLTLLRIRTAILAAFLVPPLVYADWEASLRGLVPAGAVAGIGLLLLAAAIFLMPRRRYASWGYAGAEDELTVRHGLMVRRLTIVPFGRVQHIDVAQGPIERALGLATLVLNTAGTRGAAVRLPGLLHGDAERLRDHIRAKIRQDLL
jgi:membrane protein YdbS with pleckstrin-like domain